MASIEEAGAFEDKFWGAQLLKQGPVSGLGGRMSGSEGPSHRDPHTWRPSLLSRPSAAGPGSKATPTIAAAVTLGDAGCGASCAQAGEGEGQPQEGRCTALRFWGGGHVCLAAPRDSRDLPRVASASHVTTLSPFPALACQAVSLPSLVAWQGSARVTRL
jgi:hypothetical protein